MQAYLEANFAHISKLQVDGYIMNDFIVVDELVA